MIQSAICIKWVWWPTRKQLLLWSPHAFKIVLALFLFYLTNEENLLFKFISVNLQCK